MYHLIKANFVNLSRLLLLYITLNLLISIINANEIIGCGGFIKSNTVINYQIIQVTNTS